MIFATASGERYRDLSPSKIVPSLANEGDYLASQSTFYRILREENQLTHRQRSKPSLNKGRFHGNIHYYLIILEKARGK